MFSLQKFLFRSRMTQDELSKKLNMTRSKIASWSAGYRKPDYDDIVALIKIGMSINEIFGDEVEKMILQTQPSLDVEHLTQEDCKKIVKFALGAVMNENAVRKDD